MIITLKKNTPQPEMSRLIQNFEKQGVQVNMISGANYNVFGLVGDTAKLDERRIMANEWVEDHRIAAPYKLANRIVPSGRLRQSTPAASGSVLARRRSVVIWGGPCSVEGEAMICDIAQQVKDAGGVMLRGGAYKPRTSPYAFQGMGIEGILAMVKARGKDGLPIVSELMSADKIERICRTCRSDSGRSAQHAELRSVKSAGQD